VVETEMVIRGLAVKRTLLGKDESQAWIYSSIITSTTGMRISFAKENVAAQRQICLDKKMELIEGDTQCV